MARNKFILILVLSLGASSCRKVTTTTESAEKRREKRFGEHGDYLREANHLEIFSVAPYSDIRPRKLLTNERFHGFQIYGKTTTGNQSDITTIWSELHNRVYSNTGTSYTYCFWPRHAIRAFHGENSRDYLICFECNHLHVYLDPASDEYERIGLEKGDGPIKLNQMLDEAQIPRELPNRE